MGTEPARSSFNATDDKLAHRRLNGRVQQFGRRMRRAPRPRSASGRAKRLARCHLARPFHGGRVLCVALATAVARAAIAVVVRGDVASGMAVGCAMETKGPHLLQGHGGANDASKVKS